MMFAGGDPDLAAFVSASGATDTSGIAALVAYLKAESLWTSSRFFPFKSAQNKGSGSTVYGLGGRSPNNFALVASPTWGNGGISFNGSTQYGEAVDFLSGGSLTAAITARQLSDNANEEGWLTQMDYAGNQRGWAIRKRNNEAGKPMAMERHAAITSGSNEFYHSDAQGYRTTMETHVAAWTQGGGRQHWTDKTSRSLTLALGLAQTSLVNNSTAVRVGTSWNSGLIHQAHIEVKSVFLFAGLLTTLQRETITDLLNAL